MEILEPFLKADNLTKKFGSRTVLDHISFSVREGEFISVLGKSGCGKTTMLNLILGLLTPDEGSIFKRGEDITRKEPSRRKLGVVFQNHALFPNMTALRNVEYALSIRKETKPGAREKAVALLNRLGLGEHLNQRPVHLSGGQSQRVAIARTLALNPDMILFDEPMSALDVTTRMMLREEIKKLQAEEKITMLYITHDQEEALTMSDRVIVMNEGRIEQFGTPAEIIRAPETPFVKDFVVDMLEKKMESLGAIMGA